MASKTREFLLRVETTHAADSAELDRLARNLRAELLDAPVADVQPVSEAETPPGAKALDAFSWGALRLILDPAVLKALFSTLTSWVRRNKGTSLHLSAGDCVVELKGTELDPAALQKMLETCLEAKAGADVVEPIESETSSSTPETTPDTGTGGEETLAEESETPEDTPAEP